MRVHQGTKNSNLAVKRKSALYGSAPHNDVVWPRAIHPTGNERPFQQFQQQCGNRSMQQIADMSRSKDGKVDVSPTVEQNNQVAHEGGQLLETSEAHQIIPRLDPNQR